MEAVVTYRGAVYPWHCDHVGHMNVKKIRFRHEMLNNDTGEVAAVTTLLGVHMDTTARKACAFPEGMIEKARPLLATAPA